MPEEPKPSKLHEIQAKLGLHYRLIWMGFIVFALFSSCINGIRGIDSLMPVVIVIFTVLFWASVRIIVEGIEAWRVLQALARHEREQNGKK